MAEFGFSLTRIFPYKDRILDSVFLREYTGQRKPVFWYILRYFYISGTLVLNGLIEEV